MHTSVTTMWVQIAIMGILPLICALAVADVIRGALASRDNIRLLRQRWKPKKPDSKLFC